MLESNLMNTGNLLISSFELFMIKLDVFVSILIDNDDDDDNDGHIIMVTTTTKNDY